jgi:hypothetical protein
MVLSVSSIFRRLSLYTHASFLFALIGIIITLINREIEYTYRIIPEPLYPQIYTYDDNIYILIHLLRCIVSLTTILLLICIYRYYQADFQFLQLNRVYLLHANTWNHQHIVNFIGECLICVIHEFPFVDVSLVLYVFYCCHSYNGSFSFTDLMNSHIEIDDI